jgi:hypothetical protein
MGLFTHDLNERMQSEATIAVGMRPLTIGEYIHHEHILGPGKRYERVLLMPRHRIQIIIAETFGNHLSRILVRIGVKAAP